MSKGNHLLYLKIFHRREHAIAAIIGWSLLLILLAPGIPLWLPVCLGFLGMLALRSMGLGNQFSPLGQYGFLIWTGFFYAFPYVFFKRSAWNIG